ncbi:hypothetical protein Ari01nite_46280 [Paractinoplanes rishiriensis]|uniref:Uncharacterized protein n=2 Tax=Paractinoplanes rishiriensis TaxID=1050105 RepID=A0A919MVT7_9ACTN|nr:hypothetical protein Ari01nite_46280 [Actinoplanes rishiriensis]
MRHRDAQPGGAQPMRRPISRLSASGIAGADRRRGRPDPASTCSGSYWWWPAAGRGIDYGSWAHHVHAFGRAFWWEMLQINPDQADVRLATYVAAQWRERLALTPAGKPRRDVHSLLFRVRAFYRDPRFDAGAAEADCFWAS